jgi:hypothetical protein
MLYTSPWSRFELTSVVIGTDCIGSCKSNYHAITDTTAPLYKDMICLVLHVTVLPAIKSTLTVTFIPCLNTQGCWSHGVMSTFCMFCGSLPENKTKISIRLNSMWRPHQISTATNDNSAILKKSVYNIACYGFLVNMAQVFCSRHLMFNITHTGYPDQSSTEQSAVNNCWGRYVKSDFMNTWRVNPVLSS